MIEALHDLTTTAPDSVSTESVAVPRPWLAAWTLCVRELVRFVRQRNRVIGALGQPALFWLLFGAGLGPSFNWTAAGGADLTYREYFFPGIVILILLFTAIFATISIIEDRREGFLQSVLVAPLPRWSMVLGKLLGGTLIAVLQALVFLLLGWILGPRFGLAALIAMTAFLSLVAFALTGLGFVIAWRMDSTQGFHAVMSVFLMPMWLLSGAFFPAESGVLALVLKINPLTYAVAGLRRLLYWDAPAAEWAAGLPRMEVCWGAMLLFAVVMFALAWKISGQRTTGDLL